MLISKIIISYLNYFNQYVALKFFNQFFYMNSNKVKQKKIKVEVLYFKGLKQ